MRTIGVHNKMAFIDIWSLHAYVLTDDGNDVGTKLGSLDGTFCVEIWSKISQILLQTVQIKFNAHDFMQQISIGVVDLVTAILQQNTPKLELSWAVTKVQRLELSTGPKFRKCSYVNQ
jgi:hypothetical protein